MNVSCSTETLNQTNQTVINTPNAPYISVLIILIIFFLGYGVFIFYISLDAFKRIYNHFIKERGRKEFFKLSLNLIRNNQDVTDLNPLILNITDLYKHSLMKSDLDPNFINSLIANLEKLKIIILKNDLKYCENTFDSADISYYLNHINEIISKIKEKNPFSGLNEDELLFFEQFKFDINKGDKDILNSKLVELSKMVKKKNSDITNLDNKTNTANRIAIIGTVIAIIGIIVAVVLWFFSLK